MGFWEKLEITGITLFSLAFLIFETYCFGKDILQKERFIREKEKFSIAFNEKLKKYGDKDKNGIVSNKERIDLGYKILKDEIVLTDEKFETLYGFPRPRDINGKYIPLKNLTSLIEKYRE